MNTALSGLTAAVVETGKLLIDLKRRGLTSGSWSGSQFKAKADQMAHESLTASLRTVDSTIPIVSEEDEASLASRASTYWLIDPIDGTASFAHGFPGYVCQGALMVDHQPTLAAVYAPELDMLFVAERGGGATCNGARLSSVAPCEQLTLIDNYPEPRGIAADAYVRFSFQRYIESGSIGLKICHVACGTADVFIKDSPTRDWDLAPPHLVVAEAGVQLTDLGGTVPVYGADGRRHHGLIVSRDGAFQASMVTWARGRQEMTVKENTSCGY